MKREPLILFLVLGAVLYGVWMLLAPQKLETIRVEAATLRALEQYQEDLMGRPLDDAEREEIKQGFIDDEVLLHEALKRGLQWSDSRVRQRLTRIMRGALTETVADPSVAQLQAYFRDNVDRYTTPESTTFEQVFFPWGEDVSDEQLDSILVDLRAGADPGQYGSASMVASPLMRREPRGSLVRTLGVDFANSVESANIGEWYGPIESPHGIHLVRVLERHPPEVAGFEQIERALRQEWIMIRTRELQQSGIDEIKSRYQIEIVEESAPE